MGVAVNAANEKLPLYIIPKNIDAKSIPSGCKYPNKATAIPV
jgi:hypothetical protein